MSRGCTTDVSEEYFRRLVDEKVLRSCLEAELEPTDEFSIRRHGEGYSNEAVLSVAFARRTRGRRDSDTPKDGRVLPVPWSASEP